MYIINNRMEKKFLKLSHQRLASLEIKKLYLRALTFCSSTKQNQLEQNCP